MPAAKRPISKRALIQRINRKLNVDGKQLYSDRRGVGYYVVNLSPTNLGVVDVENLEAFARKLKVIEPWEILQS